MTDKGDTTGLPGIQSEDTQAPDQIIIVEVSSGPEAPQAPIGTGGWGHGTVAGVIGSNPIIADWGHAEMRETPTVSEPTASVDQKDSDK